MSKSEQDSLDYLKLKDAEKLKLLNDLYNNQNMSWIQVAEVCNSYPNKVRRDAKKLGIKSKSRSEAQKAALEEGRHTHPTKGKEHSKEAKLKISENASKAWENLSELEKDKRRKIAKKNWEDRSEGEKELFRSAGISAVREAAKHGSKLEKFLQYELIKAGYQVEFHKEEWVIRTKLQIDIWLPEHNIAIEVDGVSHFDDVWGEESLAKSQIRDKEKNDLLIDRGCVIIRVKQTKNLSQKYQRDVLKSLLNTIENVKKDRSHKVITVEV